MYTSVDSSAGDTAAPDNDPSNFWKKGGFLNKDCIEWQVGDGSL